MPKVLISPNLRDAIRQVWQAIAPDCEELIEAEDNMGAVEMCLDADRLLVITQNQEARDELACHINSVGYGDTLVALSDLISLI